MNQRERARRDKREEPVEEGRHSKKVPQPLYDQFKAPVEGVVLGTGFAVEPSADEHAALLSSVHSDEERASLATQLQQNYGNAYFQRVVGLIQAKKDEALLQEEPDITNIAQRIAQQRGSGQPLEPKIRSEMEVSFGKEFSDVRIHADANAAKLARELGAKAFTTGNDIFFKEGVSDLGSEAGKSLLGHELTHVVQEGKGAISSGGLSGARLSEPEELDEQEAEQVAGAVVSTCIAPHVSCRRGALIQRAMPPMELPPPAAGPAAAGPAPVISPTHPLPAGPPVGPLVPPVPLPTAAIEFNDSRYPNISKRYTDWMAYKVTRDRVSTLKGVFNPAYYINEAISQWNSASGKIRKYFNNNFDNFGNKNRAYLNLLRLYQGKSIMNPMAYVASSIVPITFFNQMTAGHPDLKVKLEQAEANLRGDQAHYRFAQVGAFMPRTLNNDSNTLSRHALGRAVDINWGENPYITNTADILVIKKITGVDLGTRQSFDIMEKASKVFTETFNDEWVKKQGLLLRISKVVGAPAPIAVTDLQPLVGSELFLEAMMLLPATATIAVPDVAAQEQLLKAIHARRARLDRYASTGFLKLDKALIQALKEVGVGWGGEWDHTKDFMHFQI